MTQPAPLSGADMSGLEATLELMEQDGYLGHVDALAEIAWLLLTEVHRLQQLAQP